MVEPAVPDKEPASTAARGGWRQTALVLAAAVLIGGVLLVRFLAPLDARSQAVAELEALGAETASRPLSPRELDLDLQRHPRAGEGPQRLRALTASGDLILLHFWASWCPPCLDELPAVLELAKRLRGRRFQLVAVSYDDDWAAHDAVLHKAGGRVPPADGVWLRDPQGQDGDPARMLRTSLGTDQLPETYVLQGGQVLARFVAAQPWTSPQMQRALELLAPPR